MTMASGSSTSQPPAALPNNLTRSRRKSRFFSHGQCKFGDLCNRSHGDSLGEITTSPTVRMPDPSRINRERQEKASRINEASLGREASNAEVAQKVQQAGEETAAEWGRQLHIALHSLQATEQEELAEWSAAEIELKAQQAPEKATPQAEARRVHEVRQEEARRARQAEQEVRMVELAKEEAAMTMQHIVLNFTVVTFSAGLAIQHVLLGFESCRITIKNLPIDATARDVSELLTQQGTEPSRFHVMWLTRTPAGRQEAFLIGHEDLRMVAIGLENIEFRQERLSFEIMDHSGGDSMAASALDANTLTLTWRTPLNRLIEESLDASNIGPSTGDTGDEICPICYDAVTSPIKLGCGHVYCSACIRHFLTSTSTFPLVCIGDEDKCHVPIPIPMVWRFLPIQQFTNLLETAFITHIDHHPQNFKHCTTPDCRQVYRCTTSDTASIINCPSCLSSVCSACHEEGHEGMTCAERKLNNDPEEQERLNGELAVQSGFKKCPQCAVWIEKTEGCNHMECRCGAHICWVCMRIFNAQSIYEHMTSTHGDFYGVNENAAEPLFQPADFAEQQEALRLVDLRRAQRPQLQDDEAEDAQHRIAQLILDARREWQERRMAEEHHMAEARRMPWERRVAWERRMEENPMIQEIRRVEGAAMAEARRGPWERRAEWGRRREENPMIDEIRRAEEAADRRQDRQRREEGSGLGCVLM